MVGLYGILLHLSKVKSLINYFFIQSSSSLLHYGLNTSEVGLLMFMTYIAV
jgi:hypothetical protein